MEEIIKILQDGGALLPNDHFVGTSGRHFDTYIYKDAIFPHTEAASEIGRLFAEKYKDRDIDIVVAPAMGGIILSQWTAYHLTKLKGKEVCGIYTEKTPEGDQVFKRGYDALVKGKKVLVIEDSVTTGGSVKKVIDSVIKAGGQVIEACVMINKDPENITEESIGVPFSALAVYRVISYGEKDCPLCKKGIPINTTIGHGKIFLQSRGLL